MLRYIAAALCLTLCLVSDALAQCPGGVCSAPTTFRSTAAPATYAPAQAFATPQVYAPAAPMIAPSIPMASYPTTASYVPQALPYGYAQAGWASGGYQAPASYRPMAYGTGASAYGGGGGGGDIVSQINQLRASRGLGPVSWDGGLASEATRNSQIGFGHAYMGGASRQNSAVSGSSSQAFGQWMNSPAHLSAMLDPSVTRVGLGQSGSVFTLNMR